MEMVHLQNSHPIVLHPIHMVIYMLERFYMFVRLPQMVQFQQLQVMEIMEI
uniref:Uncharacterized protein n=1 Tax=viral metagenome TaxID=1070528 RepID=A0A6C0DJR9_9ZZZZ